MKNLLIGAISGNYNIEDVKYWIETSNNISNTQRTLLLYNNTNPILVDYLKQNNIEIIAPNFDFYGNEIEVFETNTGNCNIETSYNLIHNIRFLHIWKYLEENVFEKVLITDVRDVIFNGDPFEYSKFNDCIYSTSENIKYKDEQWNKNHLLTNLGILGLSKLEDYVYNVGVFLGKYSLVKDICKEIYLMSCGKPLVADQTSFNYLITQTQFKYSVVPTTNLAIHLHVISTGQVQFDLNNLKDYKIIHQYDRIPGFLQHYYPIQK